MLKLIMSLSSTPRAVLNSTRPGAGALAAIAADRHPIGRPLGVIALSRC
jgi:hypothetical protein